jgi:hypothetical protein
MDKSKICTKCKIDKNIEEFTKRGDNPNQLRSHCKSCVNNDNILRNKGQKFKQYRKSYYVANKEYEKEINKQGYIRRGKNTGKQKERFQRNYFKYKYNLSLEQIEEIKKEQKFLCAICFSLLLEGRHCHIDHNHATGKVRQILCNSCNQLLGRAKEDIKILNSAIQYLIKHNKPV